MGFVFSVSKSVETYVHTSCVALTKGGDTRTSASYESLVRVHDTRSRGEAIVSGELRK